MPFKCALCELDIQPGQPMLTDEKMSLAHQSCVERGQQVDPPSTVVVSPPPSAPPPPRPEAPSRAYLAHEPCVMPSRPAVCAECGKSAISMCPWCLALVHQNYGYDGGTACSTLHEGKCIGAKASRDPKYQGPVKLSEIANVGTPVPTNGKHVTPKKKKRDRR